jgi:hypothetical protein
MCRDLAQRLYRESHWPVTGSATGGDTTSLIDTTALLYSSGDANAWDRKWVYRETTPSDTVISSRVTEGGLNAGAGDLTLSPALSSSFASGNNYIITDEHIDVLKNAINRVQRNIFLPTFFPLSLHIVQNDANDMEPSTIATDYSSVNATLATESTIVKHGAQSLKSTAGAAGGYAALDVSIGVQAGQSLLAAVDCYVTLSDDATFRVVDVTDSAASIDTATSDEPSWMELVIPFSVPSNSEQIQLRMIGDANGDITYWENIQVWSTDGRVYPLPSWLTRPEQLLDMRGFRQGTGGPNTNDYRANERRSIALPYGFESVDRRANQPFHIWVSATSARPFIYALRPLDELSSDTTNSVAEQDFVVSWAARYMEAKTAQEKANVLARVRAIPFQRVTTKLPTRVRA